MPACDVLNDACSGKQVGARKISWTPPALGGLRVNAWTNLCAHHMTMWNRADQGLPPLEPEQQRLDYDQLDARVIEAMAEGLQLIPEDGDRGFTKTSERDT